MKLLVTGGAGFIGSAVVRIALTRGHRMINIDAKTHAASVGATQSLRGTVHWHPGSPDWWQPLLARCGLGTMA